MAEGEVRRRLTTIVAADVAGYSRLTGADEEGTVAALRRHRGELIDPKIAEYRGRIANTAGDSLLVEFPSVVDALRCMMEVQRGMAERNAALPEGGRIEFRVGINVGDVIEEDGDLLGDGVNIAARLEGIAAPGGVCISGSTFEQVKNKLSVGFKDLGPQQVKNIPDPVHAFGLTSAPVSVVDEAAKVAVQAPPRKPGLRIAAVAAAVAVVVISGGVVYWQANKGGPAPLSSFPENITTDEMQAGEIASLMAGMTISGKRNLDDQPFNIVLNADQTASYTFGSSGTTQNLTGKWWTRDFQFCMQIPKFAFGQKACPRIVKRGAELSAVRPVNGVTLPWTFSK